MEFIERKVKTIDYFESDCNGTADLLVSKGYLIWSGKGDIPKIGDIVKPSYRPRPFEIGKVIGYFAEDGYLGVEIEPLTGEADWWLKQRDRATAKLFGAEIKKVCDG